MKAGVVKSSAIAEHGRMDPEFYLGQGDIPIDQFRGELARMKERLCRAVDVLGEAIEQAVEDTNRVKKMIEKGQVRIIADDEVVSPPEEVSES